MIQAERRIGPPVWFPLQKETPGPRKRKQEPPNEEITIVLWGCSKGDTSCHRLRKRAQENKRRKMGHTAPRSRKVNAAPTIRRIGDEWARHWNAGELDGVVAIYAADAVYLRPHHEAVHGSDAIREYLRAPLSHGVSELAFEVTYIKQQGTIAWDVGTYRMNIPQNDGTKKEDHGSTSPSGGERERTGSS
jgi:ketosteroid isomerase-like protein